MPIWAAGSCRLWPEAALKSPLPLTRKVTHCPMSGLTIIMYTAIEESKAGVMWRVFQNSLVLCIAVAWLICHIFCSKSIQLLCFQCSCLAVIAYL